MSFFPNLVFYCIEVTPWWIITLSGKGVQSYYNDPAGVSNGASLAWSHGEYNLPRGHEVSLMIAKSSQNQQK